MTRKPHVARCDFLLSCPSHHDPFDSQLHTISTVHVIPVNYTQRNRWYKDLLSRPSWLAYEGGVNTEDHTTILNLGRSLKL
ncbi:hypothetical protein B0H12DRAFT_1092052, partial [Mycena haematopus]